MAKFAIDDFAYNGKYHDYFWNRSYNPDATITDALADCTCMAYGLSYVLGFPRPVSTIVSASRWDKVVANGYSVAPYGSKTLKIGDVIQWVEHCHVATVISVENGEAVLGCSWYTGQNGVSRDSDGKYDSRSKFQTLQQLSDFMISKYPFRFYHETSVSEESRMVGGLPENILVAPAKFAPVKENTSKDQIQVLTNEQNIRDSEMNVIGVAQKGFYNVISIKKEALAGKTYDWYEIKKNSYIAGVNGRVKYIPASIQIEKLQSENEELKKSIADIKKIIEKLNL